MKIKYLIFLSLSFILGCEKPIEITEIDHILLKKIIERGNELPSGYNFKVFVKCEYGFSETSIDELIFQYKNMNIKEEYGIFLQMALNHQYVFPDSIMHNCFELDKQILENYLNTDFNKFTEGYFIKNNDRIKIKNEMNQDQLKTIFYLCYINNYVISFNDEIGVCNLRSTKYYY